MFRTVFPEKMKENIYHNILKPLLLENKDLKSPEMQALVGGLQNQVVKILIDAPTFGKAAIKVNVQSQINAMNGLFSHDRFFVNSLNQISHFLSP